MDSFKFKSKYGQNFLNNEDVLNKIVSLLDFNKNSKIIEVGPGSGNLTKKLIEKGNKVISFEIDESLKQYLDSLVAPNLNIIYKDFLKVNLSDYFDEQETFYFVSNVPYYITTPIIYKFINEKRIPKKSVIMVQKEVAERLSAKPGVKNYGAITVLLNYFYNIKLEFIVEKNNFFPVPEVDSAVISLSKKSDLIDLENYKNFESIVYKSFSHKRKNLRNNLRDYDQKKLEEILKKYNYSLNNRAEDIPYFVFIEISNTILK